MELRVHGIGGPEPAGVLGCDPGATVVSWRSEPGSRSVVRACAGRRDVHLYHWAPLTSGSRSFALWPLLLPFTLVNVAGWMAPPGPRPARTSLHRASAVWLGLATTSATVVWLLLATSVVWHEVTGGTVQGPGDAGRAPGTLSGAYFGAAAASAAVATALLVLAATFTAAGFERFRPAGWPAAPRPWRWPWGAGLAARLDDPWFHDNGNDHRVRWRLHAALAVATWTAVVAAVVAEGTERAGHVLGRALMVVATAQLLGVVGLALASARRRGDGRRLTRRLLAASTGALGVALLGGLVLSAIVALTGIDEMPPGPLASLYDCFGWAMLGAVGATALVVVHALATPMPGERGPARALLPTLGSRLRARLATVLSSLDRIVTAVAVGFGTSAAAAMAVRWDEVADDRWRLTATAPVNVARSVLAFVLAFTVLNLVKSRAAPDALKRIGNVWDILTFWPRTYHPFAVRPYAERAVPELQHFLLTAPRTGRLVVAAHSQGSVLAYAAVRPFTAGGPGTLPPVGLVTFGSPLRALYAAVFPHYFRADEFMATSAALDGGWTNLFRFTDHVGRAVFSPDEDAAAAGPGAPLREVPIADADPPGAVLGHNDYWDEPAVRATVAGAAQPARRTA